RGQRRTLPPARSPERQAAPHGEGGATRALGTSPFRGAGRRPVAPPLPGPSTAGRSTAGRAAASPPRRTTATGTQHSGAFDRPVAPPPPGPSTAGRSTAGRGAGSARRRPAAPRYARVSPGPWDLLHGRTPRRCVLRPRPHADQRRVAVLLRHRGVAEQDDPDGRAAPRRAQRDRVPARRGVRREVRGRA